MADLLPSEPALLFCGLLCASEEGLERAGAALVDAFGPLCEQSAILPWNFSDYYAEELGEPLVRRFLFFEKRLPPARLSSVKRETLGIEATLSILRDGAARRTVNIDPGYVTPAKVVLATTKDYSHRVSLAEGIFAEVTLIYHKNAFRPQSTTYPDFRTDAYLALFNGVRSRLLPRTIRPAGAR